MELENLIAQEDEELRKCLSQVHLLDSNFSALEKQRQLSTELRSIRDNAERSREKLVSIEGLLLWDIKNIDNSNMNITCQTIVPGVKLLLHFEKSDVSRFRCNAYLEKVESKQSFKTLSKYQLSPGIKDFWSTQMNSFCDEIKMADLTSMVDIKENLNILEWKIGRLNDVVRELKWMEKTHLSEVIIKNKVFLVSLQISNNETTKRLGLEFEIKTSYPFTPMDITFNDLLGKIDIDSLKRQLLKTAKPGFGYMSRTCGIISAYLQ